MSKLFTEVFNGKEIRFETRNDGSVKGCLSDMAIATGKRVDNYLRRSATKELIAALGKNVTETIEGHQGGTWVAEEIFIDFAFWSSVEFRLWVLQIIKKLDNQGLVIMHEKGESSDDYKLREQVLLQENQRLLTEVGYLQKWSPKLSLPKMKYMEIIGYTPSEYSPFLKSSSELAEYYYSPESDWDLREGRMVHDLIDTLFEPGKKVCICDYRFNDIDKYLQSLPSKFFDIANTRSPHHAGRHPELKGAFKQFEKSVNVKHDTLYHVWLDYVPQKKNLLESYLNSTEVLILS